jgi:hypothetical protein
VNIDEKFTLWFRCHAGDFRHAAGERVRALKCGSLPRDAGDLAGLQVLFVSIFVNSTLLVVAASAEFIHKYLLNTCP